MKCATCGLDLGEPDNTEQRAPCPSCGSSARIFELSFAAQITVTSHVMMEGQHEGQTISFRESEREGRVASADDHQDGRLSMILVGTSPQGEEDTPNACRILVRTINQIGGKWSEPILGTDNADGIAHAIPGDTTSRPLRIQVVKAIVDRGLWTTLATSGKLSKEKVSLDELVDKMAEAVGKKLDPKKIPPRERRDLVLALDATRLPALAFPSVVKRFRQRHSALLTQGFRGVWVVGPTESLTTRLDEDPDQH